MILPSQDLLKAPLSAADTEFIPERLVQSAR